MARIAGNVVNGEFKGRVDIAMEIVEAALILGGVVLAFNYFTGSDGNQNTYEPGTLQVVSFSPEPGVECKGLSASDTGEVIGDTIVCDYTG